MDFTIKKKYMDILNVLARKKVEELYSGGSHHELLVKAI